MAKKLKTSQLSHNIIENDNHSEPILTAKLNSDLNIESVFQAKLTTKIYLIPSIRNIMRKNMDT